jgi:hypothetical protein
VQRLQRNLDRVMEADLRIQTENEALRRRLAAREEAERQVMPYVIRGRAPGTRLAIVVCGDGLGSETLGQMRRSLEIAGAEALSVTRLPGALGAIPEALRPALAPAGIDGAPEAEERMAARAVLRAVLSGDAGGRLRDLARATGATLQGTYTFPVRRVLVIVAPPVPAAGETVAPAGDVAERLGETALATAQEFGVLVLAAEPEGTSGSNFLRAAAQRRVTTIDNVDTASGQIALVLALAGARGNFGSRPGASPIPSP